MGTVTVNRYLEDLIRRYPILKTIEQQIFDSYSIMKNCFAHDGKLLLAGNGGSAADCEHMTGELMKRFKISRPVDPMFAKRLREVDHVRGSALARKLECSLTAIPLVDHTALSTACINDVDGVSVFAQQLFGYGRPGDVFLGISTSGNSQNIMNAAVVAKALGIKVVGLTGADGGELVSAADIVVKVPEEETYKIQELHLPIYHCWCMMLEQTFFGNET